MYVYLNQSDVEIVHLWDRYYNLTDQMLNETIKERRPLFPDKEEADLIRLSYEDVFAKLRSQSLHELLDLSSDYQLNKKNSSTIDWTNIRLQFETSMNRSLVKRLETKIQWHEKHQRNLKSFFDKKKKQFGRCIQIVRVALKSLVKRENFMDLVEKEIYNAEETASNENGVVTEESPPQQTKKKASKEKKKST